MTNILVELFKLTKNFYLTGGTVLSAFYLQHRYSEDLDLFTSNDVFFQNADEYVNKVSAKRVSRCEPVLITTFFKHFQAGSQESLLILHFSKDVSFHIKPPNRFGEILADSIEDITANKICAGSDVLKSKT